MYVQAPSNPTHTPHHYPAQPLPNQPACAVIVVGGVVEVREEGYTQQRATAVAVIGGRTGGQQVETTLWYLTQCPSDIHATGCPQCLSPST